MKSDLDSHGPLAVTVPIHVNLVGAARVTLPSPLSLPDSSSATFVVGSTPTGLPRLTLSAFRRPEHTVRLTRSDPSRRLEKEYSLRSKGCGILGHGAFSTVRLARRRNDGLKVAIKSIAKHEALRARRLRRGARSHHLDEWEVMEQMKHHPYVVSLLDIFETDDQIHLVTEYCEGGELFDAIQKKRNRSPSVRRGHYSEAQAACITRQLLTALKDLHALRLIHRDVKPENIVLVSDDDTNIHAKLCDFGMARTFDRECDSNSDTETPPSTPGRKNSFCAVSCDYYAAPEVCAMGSALRPSADIYSLGVVLYILLSGFPPMISDDLSGQMDYILFPGGQWATISDCAKHFIRQMLHPDPNKRISAEKALRSDWIRRHANPRRTIQAFLSPASLLPNGIVNDQARNRLFQALSRLEPSSGAKRRASDVIVSPRRKRRRGSMDCQRRSSIVCAMKDLYSDVASVSAAAEAAAAGVICTDDKQDVHIVCAELGYEDCVAEKQSASFQPAKKPTLSV
jgi:serine/threonine protein kinase